MAEEENWVYESDTDDEGNTCLMVDVEENVPGMSSHTSDDEQEVHSNSDSLLLAKMEDIQSKYLDLTNKLKSEKNLVRKFREESAIYKSSVDDMEESMSEERKASDLTIKTLTSNLTELQTTQV